MVHFTKFVNQGKGGNFEGPLAATISKVNSKNSVNLTVSHENGDVHGVTAVHFVHEGEQRPNKQHCQAMPCECCQCDPCCKCGKAK
jgi:hypothetical protein